MSNYSNSYCGGVCRQSNPDIKAFMVKAGIADYVGLESYYISRVTDIVQKLNKQYIIWQEPVDNGVKVLVVTTAL